MFQHILKRSLLTLFQTPRLETVSVTEPPKRQGGGKVSPLCMALIFSAYVLQVETVQERVAKMKEAGVL